VHFFEGVWRVENGCGHIFFLKYKKSLTVGFKFGKDRRCLL